jgi:hypothetical protein
LTVAAQTTLNLDLLRRSLQRLVTEEKDQPTGRGADKRRHARHLYMIEVHVKYVKRFERMSVSPDDFVTITKDLSRSGLSFVHEHQMCAGEIVQVELAVQGVRKTLLVKIIRCRRAGLRVFDIAGEFITPEETSSAGEAPAQEAAASSQEPPGQASNEPEAAGGVSEPPDAPDPSSTN